MFDNADRGSKDKVIVLLSDGEDLTGAIDEVRISNVPRSAAWLRFESAIVASNATLVTFSAEQTPP